MYHVFTGPDLPEHLDITIYRYLVPGYLVVGTTPIGNYLGKKRQKTESGLPNS